MQVKLEILKEGDKVLSTWDSHVAVIKESGEVEIFQYYLDEEGLPRLSEGTVLVTYGDGRVSTRKGISDENFVEVITY